MIEKHVLDAGRGGGGEHPKQVLKLKLMDGIISPVCLIGGWFSYVTQRDCLIETVLLSTLNRF